jgi:hypothetical protein
MDIESFFPKYPNIHKIKEESLMNPYDDRLFNDVIVNKREFSELKLPTIEPIPELGEQFNHQKIISRFLSSKTPYDELLLFHEMGTGKTCTAIGVVEQLRYTKQTPYRGALVFTRGENLGRNFMNELFFKCTDGKYIPENFNKLSDLERTHRMRKIASKYYKFLTFETFAKSLRKLSDNDLRARYNNIIVIIDEVHNLRLKDPSEEDLDIYSEFFRFLHAIENRKILLMSGTPMKDSPGEIADIMNLILPLHMQFPQSFVKDYFDTNNNLKPRMVVELASRISGRISYLKSMASTVQKVFKGTLLGGQLKHFKVIDIKMSNFQTKYYEQAYIKDSEETGVFFINARQASLFVYPDGTSGTDGFIQSRYVLQRRGKIMSKKKKDQPKTGYFLGPELAAAINHDIANVYHFGCKFGYTIDTILSKEGKSFVYCEYVNGSGAILFSLLLDHFGFHKATGDEKTKGKRYAIVTNQTSTPKEIQRLIAKYNHPDNVDGDYISVIIGSRVIAEGITLKNVINEFILTPHWNYSETSQAISRGWRVDSHTDIIKRGDIPTINIYQEVAIPNKSGLTSIDLDMYKRSEEKDVAIKQIEHVIKKTSFDCPLNIARNKVEGMDGMRECDYMTCDYKCSGTIGGKPDDITYNLYYSTPDAVQKKLTDYFKINFSIQMNQIYAMFSDKDRFDVTKAVNDLINSDIQFKNKYGFDCYLRERGDNVYITIDPAKADDYLAEYYTRNLLLKKEIDYEKMVVDMYVGDLPKRVNDIFSHPQYMRPMISALPNDVQIILIQSSILADIKKIEKNKAVRKDILTYFDGFYGKIRDKWTVWYMNDVLGTSCLDETTDEWSPCKLTQEEEKNVVIKKELLKSPIGFFGLYNPKIDTFCIRDVRTERPGDLRKLAVGKRCIDWPRKELMDIAATRMKMNPPDNFMVNATREELLKVTDKTKYFTKVDLTKIPIDDLKRLAFWAVNSRSDTCDSIRQWFISNKLMKEDLDCGQQTKKRFRVM